MTHRDLVLRLQHLTRIVRQLTHYLEETDSRLFDEPFTPERAAILRNDPDEAERVEAFGSRFGRLQDMVGNKLLPALMLALDEPTSAALANFNRAEQLGWLPSASLWSATRRLRNQLVHEYMDDDALLSDALNTAHERVAMLVGVAERLCSEAEKVSS